ELEAPEPSRDGARERAPLVAEQLALEEPGGDGGAVELDERTAPPRAQPVNQAGDQLLAGSRLAPDEDRRIGRRHRLDHAEDALERCAPADDAVEVRGARSSVTRVDASLFGPWRLTHRVHVERPFDEVLRSCIGSFRHVRTAGSSKQ